MKHDVAHADMTFRCFWFTFYEYRLRKDKILLNVIHKFNRDLRLTELFQRVDVDKSCNVLI